jgi:hypothetical protein
MSRILLRLHRLRRKSSIAEAVIAMLICCLLAAFLPATPAFCEASERSFNYERLLELLDGQKRKAPVYPFNDFQPGLDLENHRANVSYIQSHPELLAKIRNDLNGDSINWMLDAQKQRLLYVPLRENELRRIYRSYCQELIRYVADKTGFDNPYSRIVILGEQTPSIRPQELTAFIVHNLARESAATYRFSSSSGKGSLRVTLREKTFLNQIGSYSSSLNIGENGTLDFDRDSYAIWRSTARNTYTALTVPAEETLHVLLRPSTEQAIREEKEVAGLESTREVKRLLDRWLAAEEALVGGLVHSLVPSFWKDRAQKCLRSLRRKDLLTKQEFSKYCYLNRGIRLVEQIGCKDAIDWYAESPATFLSALERELPAPGKEAAGNDL